ncbi:nuclease A inhibitor family protein [Pontibacter russatus]|uniref:nuclease A inhibitor family protein n=1 Tax=Pontibacter russatus TaxID=2694929 RepID=UPI001379E864|nr:nuclease A inhibitor family protein [Pontibacter russatus]
MNLEQIETELKQAVNGLLMRSETDEPFEFFYDEEHDSTELNEETVRKLAGMPAQYPLLVVELDEFFRSQVRPAEETPDELARAERFRQLQAKLHELLPDVKVYRIGETRISVFILGTTAAGEITGLKTVLVET